MLFRSKTAGIEKLRSIEGVGEVVAESLQLWLAKKTNLKLISELLRAGVEVESSKSKAIGKFSGTTWVFTGTLEAYSRDEAGAIVQKLGGDVTGSVSSNTSYVVVGSQPGSKFDKAKSLGVKTLSEQEFKELVGL
mgnify:FL=1